MTNIVKIYQETNLEATLEENMSTTAATFRATFYDSKTKELRTPQSTTNVLVINKGFSNFEMVRVASYSAPDSNGVVTVTLASSGRNLNRYGVVSGASTGKRHLRGSKLGCVVNHLGVEELNAFIGGTTSSGGANFKVGAETDVDIKIIASNGDANPPFLMYDASENAWVFSNNGVDTVAIGSGASAYTGGDGLTITAGDIDIDLTDSTIFGETGNSKALKTKSDGKIDSSVLSIDDSLEIVGGALSAKNYTSLIEAGETITVSGNPVAVFLSSGNDGQIADVSYSDVGSGTDIAIYGANWGGQTITMTSSTTAIKSFSFALSKSGSPTGTTYLEIFATSGGVPTGSALWTASVTETTLTTSPVVRTFFPNLNGLTSGAVYAIVIRSTGGDASNYVVVQSSSVTSSVYSGGARISSTNSGSSWSTDTSGASQDMKFAINLYKYQEEGKVYISDITVPSCRKIDSFVTETVASGATATCRYVGQIAFTGLQEGQDYYLSTSGAITNAYSSIKVGEAVSTTRLRLNIQDMAGLDTYDLSYSLTTSNHTTEQGYGGYDDGSGTFWHIETYDDTGANVVDGISRSIVPVYSSYNKLNLSAGSSTIDVTPSAGDDVVCVMSINGITYGTIETTSTNRELEVNGVVATIPFGVSAPACLAYDPINDYLLVSLASSVGRFTGVGTLTYTLHSSIPVSVGSAPMAWDSRNNHLYTVTSASIKVYNVAGTLLNTITNHSGNSFRTIGFIGNMLYGIAYVNLIGTTKTVRFYPLAKRD